MKSSIFVDNITFTYIKISNCLSMIYQTIVWQYLGTNLLVKASNPWLCFDFEILAKFKMYDIISSHLFVWSLGFRVTPMSVDSLLYLPVCLHVWFNFSVVYMSIYRVLVSVHYFTKDVYIHMLTSSFGDLGRKKLHKVLEFNIYSSFTVDARSTN